jgi:hypothetical protein
MFALALFVTLSLFSCVGCASGHQHMQTDAGYTSYADTGGGWSMVQQNYQP